MEPFYASERAPAKINLSLRVVGRRADGYHELDSLFVPLSVADEVEISCEPASRLEVICRCIDDPQLDGEDNLAARAARRYFERVKTTARVTLRIHKRIWVAAGLGGGSSDAAAVLRVLQRQLAATRVALSPDQLAPLALQLGADVPFFLSPRPARAQGIGERLTPVTGLPELQLVLANPRKPLGTPEIYRGLGLPPGTARAAPPQPETFDGSLGSVLAIVGNDLEPIARAQCPEIVQLEQRLLAAGAASAAMSGSGPTVFGIFADPATARRAADELSSISEVYATYARSESLDSGP